MRLKAAAAVVLAVVCVSVTLRVDGADPATVTVKFVAPSEVQVGHAAEFAVEIGNPTDQPLSNVKIRAGCHAALTPTSASEGYELRSKALWWTIDSLAPGKTERLEFNCRAVEPTDRLVLRVSVTADGDVQVKQKGVLTIHPADDESTDPADPLAEPAGPIGPKPAGLGEPLVEDAKALKRLDPAKPLWIDLKNRQVVMLGQVCQTDAMLEMFVCLRNTKEHESVVTVDLEAYKVHAGLLAVGAKPGSPAKFQPVYIPAKGTEIEITLVYRDQRGRRREVRAQDWIVDSRTGRAMTHPFVFAGSRFWKDEETGQRHYLAESGDFICVSNFATAMLDVPIESSQAAGALMFRAATQQIPPLGTPVTLILSPKLPKTKDADPKEAETTDTR